MDSGYNNTVADFLKNDPETKNDNQLKSLKLFLGDARYQAIYHNSFWINYITFRTFRRSLCHKQITGLELLFGNKVQGGPCLVQFHLVQSLV